MGGRDGGGGSEGSEEEAIPPSPEREVRSEDCESQEQRKRAEHNLGGSVSDVGGVFIVGPTKTQERLGFSPALCDLIEDSKLFQVGGGKTDLVDPVASSSSPSSLSSFGLIYVGRGKHISMIRLRRYHWHHSPLFLARKFTRSR